MKVLTNLNLTNLRQNRSRTIMTIVGVALSVALILSMIGLATSLSWTERQEAIAEYGDIHVMYKDVPGNVVHVIEEDSNFELKYYANQIECNEDRYLETCSYWNPYPREEYEPIVDAYKLIRDETHFYNVFLKYKDPPHSERANKNLSNALKDAGFSEIQIRTNANLARLDGDVPETTSIVAFWMAFFVIGSMSIIAAFVIRNSFNISITERVRQFGMLASIGARPQQIRFMVYQEALMIGLVAIPLGIVIGIGATFGIVAVINMLLGDYIATTLLFYIPLEAYALISGVGLFIITLSAASPAIVASRVSPIAALRNVQDVKIKARKVRTSKLTQKLFGIGGVIAAKNLKRSRSKYRTTVISIVVSVSVFIGVSAFMMYGHKIINLFMQDAGANVIIYSSSRDVYREIIDKFHPQEYAYYHMISMKDKTVKSTDVRIVSRDEFARYARKNNVSGDYAKIGILQDYFIRRDYNGNPTFGRVTDCKIGDTVSFRAVKSVYDPNMETEINPDEMYQDIDSDELSEEEREDENAVVKGGYRDMLSEMQTVTIDAIVETAPMGISNEYSGTAVIYISEDHPVAQAVDEYAFGAAMFIGDEGLGTAIGEYLDDENVQKSLMEKYQLDGESFDYADIEKEMRATRNLILVLEILIYGFIIVVSLIGVTNIFNTITTNVNLRSKEFAVLKSIGMTEGEFNHMIRLESAMYTTRALLIGLPIGLLMSYGVSKLFDGASINIGWLIPWHSIIISIVVVALLVAVIMRYSVRKIKKQNIIETIRKESF